jgi:hypothetical protein
VQGAAEKEACEQQAHPGGKQQERDGGARVGAKEKGGA